MRSGLEAAIVVRRTQGNLNRDDRRFIAGVMRLLEPLFVNAEKGEYQLHERWRLKKSSIAKAIAVATGLHVRQVEYVSFSAPVPRQDWMTDDAYGYYLDVGFAHAVRRSVDPWFDAVLKESHKSRFAHGHADRDAAEELFRESFGNKLHAAINGKLFSGATYPVEAVLTDFIAFALTGRESSVESMAPLMRLLPRAIPLGKRSDREDTWNVLVA
jgi:hypothetical protein